MSLNQLTSYVYREKVDINVLNESDIDIELGTTNDQYFYFFDIKHKKVTIIQNRNLVYSYEYSKMKIKDDVLIFIVNECNKNIEIYVDLTNNIFNFSALICFCTFQMCRNVSNIFFLF